MRLKNLKVKKLKVCSLMLAAIMGVSNLGMTTSFVHAADSYESEEDSEIAYVKSHVKKLMVKKYILVQEQKT